MSVRRSPRVGSYSRARRRFGSRRDSFEEISLESYNATTPSKTAVDFTRSAMAGQFGGLGGPYLQQVMPGIHMGLTWRQMFCSLFIITIANGCLAYVAFSCWLETSELSISYTHCPELPYPNQTGQANQTECELSFELSKQMEAPVYIYYRLCNVYTNHRHIQTSWSMPQLIGRKAQNIKQSCKEFAYRDEKLILPCGALPNAIFNDTVNITGPMRSDGKNATAILLTSRNISWPSHTAGLLVALPATQLENTVKPANWPEPAARRYDRPFEDAEDLWVWLTTPAFSCFRKLMHRVDSKEGLRAGKYEVLVGNNYPVKRFGGTKSFVVAGKTFLGGKNQALAVLPSAVSAVYFLLSISTLIECYCRLRRKALALGLALE